MANTLTLDAGAQPPVGVANPAKIEFFVGTPPRRMVIFSGVAVTNFRTADEDNVAWEDVVVRLGDTTTENFNYTSTVGLASLSCDDSTPTSTSSPARRESTPTPSRRSCSCTSLWASAATRVHSTVSAITCRSCLTPSSGR